jgi:hypothetical protein
MTCREKCAQGRRARRSREWAERGITRPAALARSRGRTVQQGPPAAAAQRGPADARAGPFSTPISATSRALAATRPPPASWHNPRHTRYDDDARGCKPHTPHGPHGTAATALYLPSAAARRPAPGWEAWRPRRAAGGAASSDVTVTTRHHTFL